MADVKIKVCGLTKEREAKILAEYGVDYAGMVLFYPKSRRNVTPQTAEKIVGAIRQYGVSKPVAVTVSPDIEQLECITKLGFDYIQIHGELKQEVYEYAKLPIIRALNLSGKEQEAVWKELEKTVVCDKIKGILFDGSSPGAGKPFDWELLKNVQSAEKLLFLAGGLTAENVAEAIQTVAPDAVDVSSGVEYDLPQDIAFAGKDEEKIRKFVRNARPQKAAEGGKNE